MTADLHADLYARHEAQWDALYAQQSAERDALLTRQDTARTGATAQSH